MSHKHGLQKIKKETSFECDGSYSVLKNVSTRTVSAGGTNLYPGDTAWYCGENEKIDKLIKENVLKNCRTRFSKAKIQKTKRR